MIDALLAGACFIVAIGGWALYLRSRRIIRRQPFKWHLRWRDDGSCHISTTRAQAPSSLLEIIEYANRQTE